MFCALFTIPGRSATFTVLNTNATGSGTLRQAILDANAHVGLDTIAFNVNGGGFQTILTGDLPSVTDPAILDATTQPGYLGSPLIELTGQFDGITYGLALVGGDSTVRGFVINNYDLGGIRLGSNGNVIENNYIGTNVAGTEQRPNFGPGISIFNASNNMIGGTTVAKRNLISGNAGTGIEVNGTRSSNNVIQGNYIGTNIFGTISDDPRAVFTMRNEREGVCLCSTNGDFSVSNNLIGGTLPGAGNLISANRFDEIRISGNATGNLVQGNLIGTDAAGTAALDRSGNGGYGIYIYPTAPII